MELILLDQGFEISGIIEKFTSFQWIRRYYDVGTFELHTSTEYFPYVERSRYLYHSGADESAVIESVFFSRDQTSRTNLVLKGRFLESLLSDRVIQSTETLSGNLEDSLRALVKTCAMTGARAIPLLSLGEKAGFAETISLQATGDNLMQRLYTILQSYEMSFRVEYRYQENQMLFSLWKGLNRTQEQQENGMAIFSDSFENILETSYSRNTADYKNFAYVAGAGEGNKRILEEVDQVLPGELRRELYVDARDLRPEREDGTSIPEEEYRRILRRRGLEKLAEFRAVEAIDGKADTHANLIYRTDFDLGDLCDYANPGIGLSVRKRLTEVREIYEGGTMRLDTVFGEDYVTNIKRIVQREVN